MRCLGEFRHQIRRFLHFSEEAARGEGLEPQQHQVLLAIASLNDPTVGELAERLMVRHHSAVGMVDRLEALRLVERVRERGDHRSVHVRLTTPGREILNRLSGAHREELRRLAPVLVGALRTLVESVEGE